MTLAPLPLIDYRICDSNGTVLLDLNDGTVITTAFDLGSADPRTVSFDRTAADGQIDTTQFIGSRAVAWSGQFMGTAADLVRFHSKLRGLCHPGNRFYFYFTGPDFESRRILLRADTTSTPWSNDQEITAAWRGVDGVLEDVSLYEYTFVTDGSAQGGSSSPLIIPFLISPAAIITGTTSGTGTVDGLPYPRSYPHAYTGNVTAGTPTSGGSTAGTGALVITNPGTVPTPPVFRIYGPCTAPQIICLTTGVRMVWTGVTIPAGEYLLVDCGKKRAYLGDDPSQAPVGFDYSISDWPVVPASPFGPLDSRWQLLAGSSSPGWGAQADVRFRWL